MRIFSILFPIFIGLATLIQYLPASSAEPEKIQLTPSQLYTWADDVDYWERRRNAAVGVLLAGAGAALTGAVLTLNGYLTGATRDTYLDHQYTPAAETKMNIGFALAGIGASAFLISIPVLTVRQTGYKLRKKVQSGEIENSDQLILALRHRRNAGIVLTVLYYPAAIGIPLWIYSSVEKRRISNAARLSQIGFYASPMDAGICMRW